MIAMGRYGIKKLVFKQDECEVQLEREDHSSGRSFVVCPGDDNPLHGDFAKHHAQGIVSQDTFATTEIPSLTEASTKEDAGFYIDSPMVGTVYLAATPQDQVYVKKGDSIDENTVVCLVEAMKVMNEVKAGVRGVITEILTENAHPVEYGTRLFKVVPTS